jgi:MoxR-like ATPase
MDTPNDRAHPASVDAVVDLLGGQDYLCDRRLATAILVAMRINKPLFLEGEAGVGKTEAARALAAGLGARLIRLQCYEGIDLAHAAYEWNYARQLLHIRLLGEGEDRHRAEQDVFGPEFLLRRPLLDAIDNHDDVPPVLLIDEIDRSDEEFEAFLLEILADFAISIPELGTIRASRPPLVVLTGNRTREVHDALKRRCLYHWIDYPDLEREVAIVRVRAPEVSERLGRQVAEITQKLRGLDLYKVPGVAETVDWARALAALGHTEATPAALSETMGAAIKHQEDLERSKEAIAEGTPR